MCLQIRKMDLEARGLQPNIKAVLLAKLREYKSDLNNLKSELKRIASTNLNQAARDELLEAGLADTLAVCLWLRFASLFYSLYIFFFFSSFSFCRSGGGGVGGSSCTIL